MFHRITQEGKILIYIHVSKYHSISLIVLTLIKNRMGLFVGEIGIKSETK